MAASDSQTIADVQYRQHFVLVVTTVLILLSTASVFGRLWARHLTRQTLRSDDWMMALSLPFSYIDGVCQYLALSFGLGKHAKQVSKTDQVSFRKVLFALQRGNPPCLFCVKTSILLFYMHVFPTRTFKRCAKAMIILTALWAVAAFFSNMLQCLPVAYFWDKTIKGGSCLPVTPIGVSNASLSLAGDVIILVMPLPMIWHLQLDVRKKVAVTGIFLLGAFTCVVSLIRIILLPNLDLRDATYSQVYPGTLTYAELAIAIICGNLPVMGPLFGRWFKNKINSSRSKGQNGYLYGGNNSGTRSAHIRSNNVGGHGQHGYKRGDGFARMDDLSHSSPPRDDASDVELTAHPSLPTSGLGKNPYKIEVRTDIELDYQDNEINQHHHRDYLPRQEQQRMSPERMRQLPPQIGEAGYDEEATPKYVASGKSFLR